MVEDAENWLRCFQKHRRAHLCWLCARTHDSDIVLDVKQSFLSALSQHAKGVAVAGIVQWHAVHRQEAIARTQCAFPETHTNTRPRTFQIR